MSEVKRLDVGSHGVWVRDHGDYVLYSDYEKLEAQLSIAEERVTAALRGHESILGDAEDLAAKLAVAVEALRRSILWGESMYGRMTYAERENVNWGAITEAREALAKIKGAP